MGTSTYTTRTNPAIVLKMENAGFANGLPRKPDTVVQSSPNEPMPNPLKPEPICCAVTEFFHIQQTKESALMEGKK